MTNQDHLKQISDYLLDADSADLNIGLHAGQAGQALYLAYCARYTGEEAYLDRSMDLLQDCFSRMEEEGTIYSLCSGMAGPAWTLTHLARHGFFEADVEEMVGDLDEFLLSVALEEISNDRYDLLHSGLGVGVYFLERWLGGNRRDALSRILHALDQARVFNGDLRTWEDKFSSDRGTVTFNLGLAHGMPSIVGFLANCLTAGVPYDGLPELLAESVEWLLRQELPEGESYSCFACRIKDGHPDAPNSRLAWCYGDLGIAPVLLSAGQAAGREDWKEAAIRIARKAANRPVEESGVKDACFCHGSAGIAYIFHKFHRTTGETVFQKAAQYWYEDTRRRQRFDEPPGYKFWSLIDPKEMDMGWKEDLTLINGLAGLGMVFLAEAYDIEEDWDRCFMIS